VHRNISSGIVCSRVITTIDQQHIEASRAIDTSGLRTSAKTGPLNVLAIQEMLPHPDRHGADLQWVQMLQELRAQGHTVTHIARSGVNRERYGPPLEALGIRVLTPDVERLRFLGFDFAATWTFEQVLKENNFDLAILFHWFWNGISIPEHYMEDIRRFSPDTFIAVLTDDQQGLRELQLANLTHYWADYERSQDFAIVKWRSTAARICCSPFPKTTVALFFEPIPIFVPDLCQ
jgi:hypothetical protein